MVKLPRDLKPDVITVFDTGKPSSGLGPGNDVGVYKKSALDNRVRGTTFTNYAAAMRFAHQESKRTGDPIEDRTGGSLGDGGATYESVTIFVDFPDPDYGYWNISALAGDEEKQDDSVDLPGASEFKRKSDAIAAAKRYAKSMVDAGTAESVSIEVEGGWLTTCGASKRGKPVCRRK